jgi:hypothetical protein
MSISDYYHQGKSQIHHHLRQPKASTFLHTSFGETLLLTRTRKIAWVTHHVHAKICEMDRT